MAALFTCCLGCCGDGGTGHIPLKEMPNVQLDTHHMGTDVVIVKSGRRICGTGGCLANAPLHQNKSYFEFKIQSTVQILLSQRSPSVHLLHITGGRRYSSPMMNSYLFSIVFHTGIWGIGVATQKVNLNQVPMGQDINSLVLRHDGSMYHNNEEKNRLPANSLPQEGDIVGITYDHVELNLYLNGKNMHCPASGIRGTVFPVVYVDDSAILDCQFSDFYHTAPQGFEKILFEQQIF
uniref:SPRY domain containing 7b n=1 Tax=Oncorhynchus mykiss TaxID=8022 RepID=A0A8C7LVQ9_ONCMY